MMTGRNHQNEYTVNINMIQQNSSRTQRNAGIRNSSCKTLAQPPKWWAKNSAREMHQYLQNKQIEEAPIQNSVKAIDLKFHHRPRKMTSMSNASGSSSIMQEASLIHGAYGGQSPNLYSNGTSPAKLARVFNAQRTLDGLQNNYYKTNELDFVTRNPSHISIHENSGENQTQQQISHCTPDILQTSHSVEPNVRHLLRGSSQLSYVTPLPATGLSILETIPRLNDVQVPQISSIANGYTMNQNNGTQPQNAKMSLRSVERRSSNNFGAPQQF